MDRKEWATSICFAGSPPPATEWAVSSSSFTYFGSEFSITSRRFSGDWLIVFRWLWVAERNAEIGCTFAKLSQ